MVDGEGFSIRRDSSQQYSYSSWHCREKKRAVAHDHTAVLLVTVADFVFDTVLHNSLHKRPTGKVGAGTVSLGVRLSFEGS